MNKTRILVALLVLISVPMMLFADIREYADRFEFGASAGVGFYVGQKSPVEGSDLLRVQSYDAIAFGERPTLRWPGIETFGFSLGYRLDTRWNVKIQTTRQRLCFAEYAPNANSSSNSELRKVYYNAMWHLDAMAEYNLLNLGNVMMPRQALYNVVPYVGFGIGVSLYNKNATFRSDTYNKDKGIMYPRVGSLPEEYKTIVKNNGEEVTRAEEWKRAEIAVGTYIPVAFGVKWRVNDNVQLKGTFQYQFYLHSSNLEGASYDATFSKDRPKFEDLNKKFGSNHDCLFSLSAIFNFGKWYEDRLITY